MEELTHEFIEIEIPDGPEQRLLLKLHEGATGRLLVAIAPQYAGKLGEWKLRHSGLMLTPSVARQLAPMLLTMAEEAETEGTVE